jgi:hypothetical protein
MDLIDNIAHTTAFLYAGALQQRVFKKLDLDSWNGHTGFVQYCADYARAIETWIASRAPDDYPGVFAYELVEPFGEWLATECRHDQRGTDQVLALFQEKYLAWIEQP